MSPCPIGIETPAIHSSLGAQQSAPPNCISFSTAVFVNTQTNNMCNKKHLKNVGPIRHCEPPNALILHCHSPGVATVARRLRIDVHDDDDDNA